LDHAVAARSDESVIGAKLGEHVLVRVVRVEQHEHGARPLYRLRDLREHLGIGGAPAHVVDARMARSSLSLTRVDREHLAAPDHVAQRGQIARAAAERRARLDDPIGPYLVEHLLVDPQIEGTLQYVGAEPTRVAPRLRAPVVVELVEPVRDPARYPG